MDLKASTVDFLSIGARHDTNEVNAAIIDSTTPNYFGGHWTTWRFGNRALTFDEVSRFTTAGKSGKAISTVTETNPPP